MSKTERIIFLWFCLFSIPTLTTAQQRLRSDSTIVFSLLNNAETFFANSKYDSAIFYCDQAQAYSKTRSYKKGIAFSLLKKTEIYIDKDELETANSFTEKVNVLGQELNDSLIIAISLMQMAQINMYANKLDEAVNLFEKCTNNYFVRHPSKYAALALNDYGYTWGQKNDYEKQAEYLIKALRVYDQIPDPEIGEIAATLGNLSSLYYSLNQKDKALEYAVRSIAYREKDGDVSLLAIGCCNLSQMYLGIDDKEVLKYEKLCLKYSEQSGDEARILHSYITSSLVANSQKDNTKALEYEYKTIALLEKTRKNLPMLSRRYIAAGILLSIIGTDSALTLSYYNKALELSREINNKGNLKDVYYQLTMFYKKNNNYAEAYEAYRKHILYRDSIVTDNTKSSIAEIETKYETEKKNKEIVTLNSERRIKELQIEKQNALLAGNLLEAKQKQKEIEILSQSKELQELRIRQQDEQLEKQLLLAKTNEQQLELSLKEKQLRERELKTTKVTRNFILAGVVLLALLSYFLFNRYQLKRKIQEQEALLSVRENIAKDLHDEIGSTLTSIKILSEVSGKNLSGDQAKTSVFLQKITEQSTAAQQGISDIVWSVNPENDKLENMVIRMREYAAQTLESKNIVTSINIDEQVLNRTLDMGQRRDFLLIFKEAVNNIAKYAGASEVNINLLRTNSDLCLEISDNGKGFDPLKQTSSNGLKNMKARAKSLKGDISINSLAGEGTSINLRIPTT